MNTTENKLIIAGIIGSIVIIMAGGITAAMLVSGSRQYYPARPQPLPLTRACTMEAKICPDGSAVGRTGPNCEFAPCPTSATTSTNQPSFSFPAPAPIVSKYLVQPEDMRPKVSVVPGSFSCTASEGGIQKIINTRKYCVMTLDEGAAGTTYSRYVYTIERGKNIISLTFTIGKGTCANYDEPQKSACTREQNAFNVDSYADKLVQTIQIK